MRECPVSDPEGKTGEEIMAEKDKTEKLFVACVDIFAELVNVLVYQGKAVLTEKTLLSGPRRVFMRAG